MKTRSIVYIWPALLVLSACGGNEPETTQSADDFAARINGEASASSSSEKSPSAAQAAPDAPGTKPPQIAPPLANAAAGPYEPGTATDPESATCSANIMGPFFGRAADAETRAEIQQAAVNASAIRFLEPGSGLVADPTNPRLNLMLDYTGVIRDARCG